MGGWAFEESIDAQYVGAWNGTGFTPPWRISQHVRVGTLHGAGYRSVTLCRYVDPEGRLLLRAEGLPGPLRTIASGGVVRNGLGSAGSVS